MVYLRSIYKDEYTYEQDMSLIISYGAWIMVSKFTQYIEYT